MKLTKGRLVLVRFGTSDQVAEVLGAADGLVRVRKWMASSQRWGTETKIPEKDVVGKPGKLDERAVAARASLAEERGVPLDQRPSR